MLLIKEAVSQMERELKKTKTTEDRMEISKRSQWGLASMRTRLNIKEDFGINQDYRLRLTTDSTFGPHITELTRLEEVSSHLSYMTNLLLDKEEIITFARHNASRKKKNNRNWRPCSDTA